MARDLPERRFMEFFAGGGMARAGLAADGWQCAFANDFDFRKAGTYRLNWGDEGLAVGDVRGLNASDLPEAELAWASFPCQDLSLAGGGAGLKGERSGTFYPFWQLVNDMAEDGKAPRIVALENVVGTLTSHKGKDFTAICRTYSEAGYRFGALVIDAALFVPQSRPRLFVVGLRGDNPLPDDLVAPSRIEPFHTRGLSNAVDRLPAALRNQFVWWNVPTPPLRKSAFIDLIESDPTSVEWHSKSETKALLAMMSPVNLAKVAAAKKAGRRMVGAVYKRTRVEDGTKVQRAEVRFDDVAGCLRTPAGGSSRQLILVVDGNSVRSRLISSRETARLMGLPDSYRLPDRYNEAYHLTGDGVVVPVVEHLSKMLLTPLLVQTSTDQQADDEESPAA